MRCGSPNSSDGSDSSGGIQNSPSTFEDIHNTSDVSTFFSHYFANNNALGTFA